MKQITIRDFNFDLEPHLATDYARNKTITRILNAFSLLLPVGERYFIESIRAYREDVTDEEKEYINLFIRQEGPHGKQHKNLNAYLDVDTAAIDSEALRVLNKYGKDISKEHALLVTVTLERFTGLMGIILPISKSWIFPNRNEYAHLWINHGKEELEHIPVGEHILKNYTKFGYLKQAQYMCIAGFELGRITYNNYKRLKHVEDQRK